MKSRKKAIEDIEKAIKLNRNKLNASYELYKISPNKDYWYKKMRQNESFVQGLRLALYYLK